MKQSQLFQKMIKNINSKGIISMPRSLKIKELLDYKAIIKNPLNLSFDFDDRHFSWKYLAAELLWYFSGSLESKNIWNYAKLWNEVANKDGTLNSNYGFITLFKETPSWVNQYNFVLTTLLRDKDSRQALIRYNSNEHIYEGNKDMTCTISNQFFIRENKLHMIVNMRSNDAFYGFQYDLVWFGLLLQSLRLDLIKTYPDLKLGEIHYNAGSIHFYESMFDTADKLDWKKWIDYRIKLKKSFSVLKDKTVKKEKKLREELWNIPKWGDYKAFIKKNFSIKIS